MVSVTIIEKYDTYTVIECARCGADGSIYTGTNFLTGNSNYKTCPTCDGKGKVRIEKTPPLSDCGRCGGDGQKSGTCSACGGTGVVSDDELESY